MLTKIEALELEVARVGITVHSLRADRAEVELLICQQENTKLKAEIEELKQKLIILGGQRNGKA